MAGSHAVLNGTHEMEIADPLYVMCVYNACVCVLVVDISNSCFGSGNLRNDFFSVATRLEGRTVLFKHTRRPRVALENLYLQKKYPTFLVIYKFIWHEKYSRR